IPRNDYQNDAAQSPEPWKMLETTYFPKGLLKGFLKKPLQGGATQIFPYNLSIRIDHKRGRYGRYLIQLTGFTVPLFQIGDLHPTQSIIVNGIYTSFFRPIKGYTQDGKALIFICIVLGYNVWIFFTAWPAPGRPKVEKHVLAPKIRQRNGFTVWSSRGKIGRHLPYA